MAFMGQRSPQGTGPEKSGHRRPDRRSHHQKKLSDVIVKEARDRGLYTSITDNGAGGISCSVAEMAKECNGCHVLLDKVPLKYPGWHPGRSGSLNHRNA